MFYSVDFINILKDVFVAYVCVCGVHIFPKY